MKYDVTIGIPVYRAEDYIRKSMESALAQTYSSIEFLILDDACDDQSISIIQELQSSHPRGKDIRILSHQQNQGAGEARNHIIDEAQGRYLYFMDSDDKIDKGTITLLIQQIQKFNAEIAFGSYEKIELDGTRTVYQYPEKVFDGKDDFANFAYRRYAGIQASACNFLVDLSLLRQSGLRFSKSNFWEDTVFTLDLVTYIQRAVLLPDITYSYLCRKNSLSDIHENNKIRKKDIVQYLMTVEQLKQRKESLIQKAYYPNRCYVAVMSDFYIICNILKRGKYVTPRFTTKELKCWIRHPATLPEILSFRQRRMQNVMLYLLGKLPSPFSILLIKMTAKRKGLI